MEKAKKIPDAGALRVLILEDIPSDVELAQRALRRAGIPFSARVTKNRREFSAALARFYPQVILSDFKLPGFDGMAALALARARAPEIPFIFVSGSIGEEKAITSLSQGAADYVFKDNLTRLGPVLKRVLAEAETRRQKAETEKSLHESEEKYRTLIETSPDAIITIDGGGRITFASHKALDLFAVPGGSTVLGASVLDFVDPADATRVQDRLVEILSGSSLPEIREYRLRRRDKEPFWAEISSAPLRDAKGRSTGLLLICRDISGRKRMENALQESEERYRLNFEHSPMGLLSFDEKGVIIACNDNFVKIIGSSRDAIIGLSMLDLPDKKLVSAMHEALSGSPGFYQGIYSSVTAKKSTPVRCLFRSITAGGGRISGGVGIIEDISERLQAETIQTIQFKIANAMVTASDLSSLYEIVRKELSALFDTTNFLVALYDEASGMLSAPFEKDEKDVIPQWPAEKSLTGLVIKQKRSLLLLGKEIQQLDQAGSTDQIGSNAEAWLGVPLLINEKVLGAIVVQSYDNADAYNQSSVNIMEMIASQLSVYIERKGTEANLLREKAYLEKLVETAPEGIAITDCLGRVLQVNREFANMFGYTTDEAVGKLIDDLVAPPDFLEEAGTITSSVGTGKSNAMETVRKRKDGTLFNVSIIGAPILIAERQVAVFAIYRDISESKRAEEQIRAALKEKEVLLQEIHHRVKNNLQIVSGLLTLQAGHAAAKSVAEILQESQDRIRSIALVHESLYKSHNLAEIAFDDYLRSLIGELLHAHGIAAGRVAVAYETERILLSIEKAIPLGLIVNELVTNSLKHAFPGDRRGEIRIGFHECRDNRPAGENGEDDSRRHFRSYELTVADDGIGLGGAAMPDPATTLGLQLLAMLAGQLQSELIVEDGPGARFRLAFRGERSGAESGTGKAQGE